MVNPPSRAPTLHRRSRRGDRIARRLARLDPGFRWPLGLRLLLTVAPFAGFGCVVLLTCALAGGAVAAFITGTTIGSFIGAGTFVGLAGLVEDAPVNVWALATLVVYGDIATTLVMLANFHLLFKLPFLGPRLLRAQEASWNVLRANRWMRRAAWFGVAIFIAVPFQGTGAVVSTVLARLLALSPWSTFTAVAAGSALGCFPLALLGANLSRRIETFVEHPVMVVGFFAIFIALMAVLGRRFTGAGPSSSRPRARRTGAVAIGGRGSGGNGSGGNGGGGTGSGGSGRTRKPEPIETPVPNVSAADGSSSYLQ
jgi:uncharacterized membrane protein